jgi:hypothetical protein
VAEPAIGANPAPAKQESSTYAKRRGLLWGLGALAAVLVAGYAATTQTGRARLQSASISGRVMAAHTEATQPFDARDARKLVDAVRELSTERNRLAARLATTERRLADLGSTVAHLRMGIWEAWPLPEFAAAAPQARLAAATQTTNKGGDGDITSSIGLHETGVISPADATHAKIEYGLDLGSGASVEALRTTWASLTRHHGGLLEGLHPIVNLRERSRPGGVDLHLIAGPLSNAAMAARLCATMAAAGAICQPAVFDGQRLAVP